MHVTDFVASYFEAWNHRDPEAIADHLATDGIYRDVPENTQRTHDELIVSLKDFFSRFKHRYELIGEIVASSQTVAFQYRMLPHGKSGKPSSCSFQGAEFMLLHGDAAMTITDYYDIPDATRPGDISQLSSRDATSQKYAKSGLSESQLRDYKRRLEDVMHLEHAYLRSDLTLPKLAKAIDCSVNHLSQVINSGFQVGFFEYVNQLRIEHAKVLLSRTDSQRDAVLNIAFTVGFNSNSAFYAAFKKCVGQTPGQFRRLHQGKAH